MEDPGKSTRVFQRSAEATGNISAYIISACPQRPATETAISVSHTAADILPFRTAGPVEHCLGKTRQSGKEKQKKTGIASGGLWGIPNIIARVGDASLQRHKPIMCNTRASGSAGCMAQSASLHVLPAILSRCLPPRPPSILPFLRSVLLSVTPSILLSFLPSFLSPFLQAFLPL